MVIQFGVRLIGITYLILGVIGFLPFEFLNPVHHEGMGVPYLLNLVAINIVHNLIHLAIGISGVIAAKTERVSRLWGRITGAALLLVFAGGIVQAVAEGFPRDQMFLGLVPLNSPGHILHLVTGGICLYLSFVRLPRTGDPMHRV